MSAADVCLEGMVEAANYIHTVPEFRRTPTLANAQDYLGCKRLSEYKLYLKLESMQFTGSFKYRGVLNQMRKAVLKLKPGQQVVTCSCGNYGIAFATVAKQLGLSAIVVMPPSAPKERINLIKKLGAEVDIQDICNHHKRVAEYAAMGQLAFHAYDDVDLVQAYGSVGFEMIEQIGCEPDVILIPCGGGGIVSGFSAAVRLSGFVKTKIYAVEPTNAATLYESLKQDRPISIENPTPSVAYGLVAPSAGQINFELCKKHTNGVLLVNDDEVVEATTILIKAGLLVEPSAAVGLAALLFGKVPENVVGKKVAILVTGRNISPEAVGQYMTKQLD